MISINIVNCVNDYVHIVRYLHRNIIKSIENKKGLGTKKLQKSSKNGLTKFQEWTAGIISTLFLIRTLFLFFSWMQSARSGSTYLWAYISSAQCTKVCQSEDSQTPWHFSPPTFHSSTNEWGSILWNRIFIDNFNPRKVSCKDQTELFKSICATLVFETLLYIRCDVIGCLKL